MNDEITRVDYETWKAEVNKHPAFKRFNEVIVNKRVYRFYKFIAWITILIGIYYLITLLPWTHNLFITFKNMWPVNMTG